MACKLHILLRYILLILLYFLYRYMMKKSRRIEHPNNSLSPEIFSHHQVLGTSELQVAYQSQA